MTFGTGSPIAARAIIQALDSDEAAAKEHDANVSQAALDEAELRELEQAEYYGQAPSQPQPAEPARRRSLIDRLLRRR